MTRIACYYPKSVFAHGDPLLPAATERLAIAGERLCTVLAALDDESLQERPAIGTWSPGEVSDHLILATGRLAKVVKRACEDRPPPVMPMGELGAAGKPVSPSIAEPRPGRAREELIADVRLTVGELSRAVQLAGELGKLDRMSLCHSFFGELTTLECLQMAGWHFEHHLRQLPQDSSVSGAG